MRSVLTLGSISVCSESWGMGVKEFRKAPMMHHKLTTLAITRYTIDTTRRKIYHEKNPRILTISSTR
jgi:hypothetical protein